MASIRTAFALSLVATTVLAAQQSTDPAPPDHEAPGVTFRVEVNYVEVDALVIDAQGNPVTDLTAQDFELLEEGVPQAVASFSMVHLPFVRPETPIYTPESIEPDVRSNATQEGRIYVILLDDLHVHPERAPRVRAALRQFIEESFGTDDVAAVISARGSSRDSQDFTSNPRLLLAAVDRFTGKTLFEAGDLGVVLGEEQEAPTNPAQLEEAHRGRTLMQSIRTVADFLGGVRGRRKTMILVSEGVGYDIYNAMHLAGGTASGVLEDSEKAVAALTRANVSLYAIDPRGLLDSERLGDGVPADQVAFRRAQDSLRVLAAQTGGFAAVNQNEFGDVFDRIVRENSSYYILGYHPANERREGRFRTVDVRVARPGLVVRSRRGYIEPRGEAPKTSAPAASGSATTVVARALGSPLPVKGVPVSLFAAPFKGSSDKARVDLAIEFDPSNLGFTEEGGRFVEHVEVMHSATEPGGRIHEPVRHGLRLAFRPETFERAKARGVRVLSEMELRPGRYQLRAAVGNQDGTAGSVLYDLEVPDFQKSRIEMSGLLVTSALMASVATVRPSGEGREVLPGPVTAAREFETGDTLAVYGEVYENLSRAAPHTIDIITELRHPDGRALASAIQQRAADGEKSGTYAFTSQLNLGELEPGLYVLHIEARSNMEDRPAARRSLQIRVTRSAPDCAARPGGCRVAGRRWIPPFRS